MPGTVRGLFYGDAWQLAAQSVGVLTCIVFVFVTFYVFFKVVDAVMGNRVAAATRSKASTCRRWASSATRTSCCRQAG